MLDKLRVLAQRRNDVRTRMLNLVHVEHYFLARALDFAVWSQINNANGFRQTFPIGAMNSINRKEALVFITRSLYVTDKATAEGTISAARVRDLSGAQDALEDLASCIIGSLVAVGGWTVFGVASTKLAGAAKAALARAGVNGARGACWKMVAGMAKTASYAATGLGGASVALFSGASVFFAGKGALGLWRSRYDLALNPTRDAMIFSSFQLLASRL